MQNPRQCSTFFNCASRCSTQPILAMAPARGDHIRYETDFCGALLHNELGSSSVYNSFFPNSLATMPKNYCYIPEEQKKLVLTMLLRGMSASKIDWHLTKPKMEGTN